jgi:Uma2 family endonuclease
MQAERVWQMAQPATHAMSPAEFFAWQEQQSESYELVNGRPVPRSIVGATQQHDRVVINAIIAFGNRLRGTGCWPSTHNVALRTGTETVRRPDLTIDSSPIDPLSHEVSKPILALEVLSPSTTVIDKFEKLEEYKGVPSIEYVLIAEPGTPHVILYTRQDESGWTNLSYIGADSELPLPKLGCTIPLAELYEGVPQTPPLPAS